MTTYNTINDIELDPEKPIKSDLMYRIRDNPDAVARGDVSVPVGKRILLPQAPVTAETDTTKVLRPDGAGGVLWGNVSLPYNGACNVAIALAPDFVNYDAVITLPSDGIWVINAHGDWSRAITASSREIGAHGMCIVNKSGGTITILTQSSLLNVETDVILPLSGDQAWRYSWNLSCSRFVNRSGTLVWRMTSAATGAISYTAVKIG